MLDPGATAPAFELPGTTGTERTEYRLRDAVADGPVVLAFYPYDFAPVCTDELCALSDADLFTLREGVSVLAVSTDGVYSHMEFTGQYDFQFPLLSDTGEVAEAYDVRHCEGEFEGRAKRALFLVDADRTVRYAWATDDPYDHPDLATLKRRLDDVAPPAGRVEAAE